MLFTHSLLQLPNQIRQQPWKMPFQELANHFAPESAVCAGYQYYLVVEIGHSLVVCDQR